MHSEFKVDIIASWFIVKNVELDASVQIKHLACLLSA